MRSVVALKTPMNFSRRLWLGLLFLLPWFLPDHVSGATYTLTLVTTNGSGTVGRNPTNSAYPQGAVVTITALPTAGWSFNNWGGDAGGTNNPLNVTMDANKTITATFVQIPSYNLTVNVSGEGSVSPSGGSYLSNTVVSLTVTPSNGWVFDGWSGAAAGSANPLALNMNGPKNITATFGQPPYITAQPQNTNVTLGATVTLQVSATGSPPLSYQWQLYGNALGGQTNSSLVLTNVQAGGDYRVLVSNLYGSATSQVAVVTALCAGTNVVSDCTDAALRQAVSIGGLIRFCCNGTLVLTNTITVTKDVTLDGSGSATVISGNNAVRLFRVTNGVTLMMTNVVLASGRVVGTNGLRAEGANLAQLGESVEGAGIYNQGGIVRLFGSVLRDHSLRGGDGGRSAFKSGSIYGTNGGFARGAAMFNNGGILELRACVLSNNAATGGNGGAGTVFGPQGSGHGGPAFGGALFNQGGVVSLINTCGASNSASAGIGGWGIARGGDAGGGFIGIAGGTLTATNCTLVGNKALVVAGGGIDQIFISSVTNSAAQGGAIHELGGMVILDSTHLEGNNASGLTYASPVAGHAVGGAIMIQAGEMFIRQCSLATNSALGGSLDGVNTGDIATSGAAHGGAIFNGGFLSLTDSRLNANLARAGSGAHSNAPAAGGGLYNTGTAALSRVLFDQNAAVGGTQVVYSSGGFYSRASDGMGGGIANSGALNLTNSTLSSNLVRAGGGASGPGASSSAGRALGGGLYSASGTVMALHVTVAANSLEPGAFNPAYYDSGARPSALLGANAANTNGSFILQNSLLAYPGTNANAWGVISDGGYNMCSDGSASFSSGSSFNFTDPRLLTLNNNGGPTPTMALAADSPALDWAPLAPSPATDQRGFPRPYGFGADLGPYEAGPTAPPLAWKIQDGELRLSFAGQAGFTYSLERSTNLTIWELVTSTGVLTTNGPVSWSVSLPPPYRFFRLRLDF